MEGAQVFQAISFESIFSKFLPVHNFQGFWFGVCKERECLSSAFGYVCKNVFIEKTICGILKQTSIVPYKGFSVFCDTGTHAGCGDKSNILQIPITQIDKFKNVQFLAT